MESGLFYELLRVALGTQDRLSRMPSEEEWRQLFAMAEKQCVDGIAYHALERLSNQGQKPSEDIVLDWYSYAEQIKEQNRIVNRRCKEVTKLFAEAGYETCILKGQGNGLMYDGRCKMDDVRGKMDEDPPTSLCREANDMPKEVHRLGMLRVPGDIDIWVKGEKEDIIRFCRSKVGKTDISSHHIEFPIFDDVPVEVHFLPAYAFVPRFNKRTLAFFMTFQTEEIHGVDEEGNDISLMVPEKKLNLVFQLSHMMRHFFHGGIGLRQMIDYYYLLSYALCDVRGKKEDVRRLKEEVAEIFEYLGMRKFAGAVMWIMKEVLGMDEQYLIVAPDEKRGRLVLSEIMEGGNFGRYDERWTKQLQKKSATLSFIARNLKLVPLFPEEALWAPIMGVYRFLKFFDLKVKASKGRAENSST